MNTTTKAQRINKRQDAIWEKWLGGNGQDTVLQSPQTDKLILRDSTKTKLACWQLINERTKVVYADIYSDGLAEMIAGHDYKVTS